MAPRAVIRPAGKPSPGYAHCPGRKKLCSPGKVSGRELKPVSGIDTLFLTMPISWQGMLANMLGKRHGMPD